MSDIFGQWQPKFAEHGLATFPVKIDGKDKVPAIRGWQKIGLRGSAELARKFPDTSAIGIALNQRRMVVDIDTKSQSVLADVLARYGHTPLIAQTASKGGYHCYYGENTGAWRNYRQSRRAIKPEADKPVDYLGCGFAVVPPSATPRGRYEFIEGTLDDIGRLPPFRGVVPAPHTNVKEITEAPATHALQGMREHDGRNNALFMAIGPQARSVYRASGSRDDVLAFARKLNAECEQPMNDNEVQRTVNSVWGMTLEGRNFIGQSTAFCLDEQHLSLEPDSLKLLAFLRLHQGPHAHFWCTNGLAARAEFKWDEKRLARARRDLIERDYLVPVRQAGRGNPALFRWGSY